MLLEERGSVGGKKAAGRTFSLVSACLCLYGRSGGARCARGLPPGAGVCRTSTRPQDSKRRKHTGSKGSKWNLHVDP